MKKNIKYILTAIILLVVLIIVSMLKPVNTFAIKSILNAKYSSYSVDSLKLQYIDWSSSVREVDEMYDGNPTMAEVVIHNNDEQRTIHFKKILCIWCIDTDLPDYGPNIGDGEYYAEINSENISSNYDVDTEIQNRWYLPYSDGTLYKKAERSDYYYYQGIKNMYRTNSGKVQKLNKDKLEWVDDDTLYSDLTYYSNYVMISEDDAKSVIATHEIRNEQVSE